ncbi:MAG: O-antigen ligase family protein [Verrucomicrobiota bacterium]
MGYAVLAAFFYLAFWLLRRDSRRRNGISNALWIPTFWMAILMSRPLSMWLGFGGGTDTLEGSPLDRLLHFFVIGHALVILNRRRINWSEIISGNWPVFLFYGFFLISVLWADPPFVSFKRWFKDLGMVFIALVILTERKPMEAIRSVFVRCAYVLIPLSVIFIRWFPEWGRFYSRHGGGEITGVTTQKNSLGITAMICGLIFLWDWLETRQVSVRSRRESRAERMILLTAMGMSVYLIDLSQSKTSLICFLVGAGLIAASYVKSWAGAMRWAGIYVLLFVGSFYALDSAFGLTEKVLGMLGRDLTFTGRTEVWEAILALDTPSMLGTGFCNFWSNKFYLSKLPYWVAHSAHNGYLEVYLDGGWMGVTILGVLLIATWSRIGAHLKTGDQYAMVRLAVFLCIAIGSFSESHFGRLGPLWFLFILIALDPRSVTRALPFRSVAANVPGYPFRPGVPSPSYR